jgi:holo-[acyl-carrier protein] synthase
VSGQPSVAPGRSPTQAVRSGVDLVPIARIARLVSEQPAILATIFTAREMAYCDGKRRRYEHLAARFAAKEAVLKALGTGLGTGMTWTEVEVVNEINGRPTAHLHGAVAAYATRCGLVSLDISLSHTADLAIAQAVLVLNQA